MPVTADVLRVIMRWQIYGELCENVGYFHPVGAAFLTATPLGVAEAYWDDVKTAFRAILPADYPNIGFVEVLVEEMDGTLGYAHYPIPVSEAEGTRTFGASDTLMPNFVSVSGTLTVGTRSTRPGSKRWSPIYDDDVQFNNSLGTPILALAEDWLEKWSTVITLGAPVATGTLVPVVASLDSGGAVDHYQDITGQIVKTLVSHQTSRTKR